VRINDDDDDDDEIMKTRAYSLSLIKLILIFPSYGADRGTTRRRALLHDTSYMQCKWTFSQRWVWSTGYGRRWTVDNTYRDGSLPWRNFSVKIPEF